MHLFVLDRGYISVRDVFYFYKASLTRDISQAVNAFEYLAKTEGIIPAIESAHAVAHAMKIAPAMDSNKIIVITISGRGDKDCAAIARYRGEDIYE